MMNLYLEWIVLGVSESEIPWRRVFAFWVMVPWRQGEQQHEWDDDD